MAGARKKSASAFVVSGPLVQAVVGGRVLHFYNGDVLPQGVDDESLQNLKDLGLVVETEVDAPAEPDAE